MSLISEKLKIMIRKKDMRIRPSIRLKATVGLTGCKYDLTLVHARLNHELFAWSAGAVESAPAAPGAAWVCTTAVGSAVFGGVAQPAAIKSAFVSRSGATMKSRTLKSSAK